jgi:hypothetical protein
MATPTAQQIKDMVTGQATLHQLATQRFWLLFEYDIPWKTQTNLWGDEERDEDAEAGDPTCWVYTPSIDAIRFKDDIVLVSCSASACSRGCCGTLRKTYEFPLSYLWTDENTLLAGITARHEAAKLAEADKQRRKAEQKRLDAEEWAREQEELDRQEFERLTAKYTGGAQP